MIRQLDVAAAGRVAFAATVGAVCPATHRVTVGVHVDRTDRLGLDVAVAVAGRRGGSGHERRVGAVLAQRDGVVADAARAGAQIVRMTVVDEDGATAALETFVAPTTTTHGHNDNGRQQDDGQRHADPQSADQRQLQQSRRRVQCQRRSADRHSRSHRTDHLAAVVSRVTSGASAEMRVVRQRDTHGTVETWSLPTRGGGHVDTRQQDVATPRPKEARCALAHVVGNQIVARAAVKTRRAHTVINVRLAEHALEADVALTSEVVDGVDTSRTVQTWISATVVYVLFTHRAFIASRTNTAKSIHSVHALTACSPHHSDNSRSLLRLFPSNNDKLLYCLCNNNNTIPYDYAINIIRNLR